LYDFSGLPSVTSQFSDTTSHVTAAVPLRFDSSSIAPPYNEPALLWHITLDEVVLVICFAIMKLSEQGFFEQKTLSIPGLLRGLVE
jgi:hypothetical protein